MGGFVTELDDPLVHLVQCIVDHPRRVGHLGAFREIDGVENVCPDRAGEDLAGTLGSQLPQSGQEDGHDGHLLLKGQQRHAMAELGHAAAGGTGSLRKDDEVAALIKQPLRII